MRHIATYPEITAPRWGKEESEYTFAKNHPKYVYGTSKNACLIHNIKHVKLRWWTYGAGGRCLVRLQTPSMLAETFCSMCFFLNSTKAKTCSMPDPNAVLCNQCHGFGRNFPKGKQHAISKQLASIRKGCMSEGLDAI